VAYKLWSHRNDIKHGNSIKSEEKLVKQVIWEVRTRVLSRDNFELIGENVCASWSLPITILKS
jgi:hypothetical protein